MNLFINKYFIICNLIVLFQFAVYSNVKYIVSSDLPDTNAQQSFLTIHSNIEDAQIFLDTTFIGTAPLVNYPITPGRYLLSIFSARTSNWYRTTYSDSIIARNGENISKEIILDKIYYVNSIPSGANVIYNDSLVGITPTILSIKDSPGFLKILKDGYQLVSIPLEENKLSINISLIPQNNLLNIQPTFLSRDGTQLQTSVYLWAGGTVAFGITAALCKIQADENYRKYRTTSNEHYLKKVKKFDVISGISLAACEISSFILAYLLLSE
jgi:hypothetical protein